MPTLQCPICGQAVVYTHRDEVPYRPFCSARCKHVDLGRWLSENYRISEEATERYEDDALPPDLADRSPQE